MHIKHHPLNKQVSSKQSFLKIWWQCENIASQGCLGVKYYMWPVLENTLHYVLIYIYSENMVTMWTLLPVKVTLENNVSALFSISFLQFVENVFPMWSWLAKIQHQHFFAKWTVFFRRVLFYKIFDHQIISWTRHLNSQKMGWQCYHHCQF